MYADSPAGEATTLAMEYSTDLFDPAWAGRFLRCMANLLAHAAEAPGTAVCRPADAVAAERDGLIIGRKRQALPDQRPTMSVDVRRLLQASTSRVIDGGEVVPMSEVCDRAARFARTLADHGVGIDTPVGLCVERGIDMLAALLGVWWAGGAYVPLDPAFPQARLALMASGAGLQIIISDSAYRDLARSVAEDAEVIRVDDPATTAGPPLAPVPVPANALAYIIFTSGSTGQPKGVGYRAPGCREPARVVPARCSSSAVRTDSWPSRPVVRHPRHRAAAAPACGADLVIATAEEAREPDRLRSLIERTARPQCRQRRRPGACSIRRAACPPACGCA